MKLLALIALLAAALPPAIQAQTPSGEVSENVYKGELVSFPGPWQFQVRRAGIILVRDDELDTLASNPDKAINMGTGRGPNMQSLRQICERAKASGARTLMIAFDHFFAQYRPGQDTPRRYMPDTDEYIQRIAAVGKFARNYGLSLELSLLTPLELGKAYTAKTGESGVWMHYREGLRDPKTGSFSVELWRQLVWVNNKGPIDIQDAGVRAFAFRETPIGGTAYHVVDPASIVEIKDGLKVEKLDNFSGRVGSYRAQRVRISGGGAVGQEGLDHVMVVQMYRTPEMDYFSDKALPFLTGLIDRYVAAGVHLNALYSDEMHIQQDWGYFNHHDDGEFAVRYLTPNFARRFAAKYGAQYEDFAKYLVYFLHGQDNFVNDVTAKEGTMHVLGSSPEAVRQTALLRARYFHMLQDDVVDLFVQAKHYAERQMGNKLEARAHATWAQSPTIDYWETGPQRRVAQYDYTSNFVWSNTVHQASAACADYFKWGDFLTGNGNDHAEGGWADRDYYAMALASSTGILNEVPYSYAAHWGIPNEFSRLRSALESVYGTSGAPQFGMVEDLQHRDVNVLMLYPLDLVASEERFGSWMTQYGYTNYVTPAKLLERGKISGKSIEMAGRRFTTVVALFEPFPSEKLMAFMKDFAAQGGRVIWSGPPPVVSFEGNPILAQWQDLFGVDYAPTAADGRQAAGKMVTFEGALAKVTPQIILTDFLPDRVYAVAPRQGTQVVARLKGEPVGTVRGTAVYLGYRPRDDQSKSLGYETRNWFQILTTFGAYPGTGRFAGVDDNTEYVSRNSPYLACRFPNGTVALAPHFNQTEEDWPGGFGRDPEQDRAYMKTHPVPSNAIALKQFKVNGHNVTYEGRGALAFRVSKSGELIAFAGEDARQITIDGKTTVFADQPMTQLAWAPVKEERRVPGGAVLEIAASGSGTVRIPAAGLPAKLELVREGQVLGSRGAVVPSKVENGALVFTVSQQEPPAAARGRRFGSGMKIYAVPVK